MLLITFDSYILDSYFKFKLFHTVFVGVKIDTYHISSISFFITYLVYTIVTIIMVKKGYILKEYI